ncbi:MULTISPECIES: hypothetical protein [Allobacillus]|uniref:DUF4306 domain-containing protein n=1 Tax=Allobacillus salarius TaxID=1955272 RepID=A0A556P8S2_9BACI|nr:hypothetical protein [Allobacillus salarius]TSJ60796.1 hypothetical protein FPQ13_11590 [Allobacillus salarius]
MKKTVYFLIAYGVMVSILYISLISLNLNPFYFEMNEIEEGYTIENHFHSRDYLTENIDDELMFAITRSPVTASNQLFLFIVFILPILFISIFNLKKKKYSYKPKETLIIFGLTLIIIASLYIYITNSASDLISLKQ